MLIFEKSRPGRGCDLLPECDVEVTLPQDLSEYHLRIVSEQIGRASCRERVSSPV